MNLSLHNHFVDIIRRLIVLITITFSVAYLVSAQTHEVIYILGEAETISYDNTVSYDCLDVNSTNLKPESYIAKKSKKDLKKVSKKITTKKSLVKKEPKVLPKNNLKLNFNFQEGQNSFQFTSLQLVSQVKILNKTSQFAILDFSYRLLNTICGCLNFTPFFQLENKKEPHFSSVGRAPPIS